MTVWRTSKKRRQDPVWNIFLRLKAPGVLSVLLRTLFGVRSIFLYPLPTLCERRRIKLLTKKGFRPKEYSPEKTGRRGFYEKLIDDYLNKAHRDNPGTGCAFSALAGEIARSDKRTRALASEQIRNDIQLIAALLAGKDKRTARSRAILTFSALVGAMSLARAVSDEALSREILKTVAELLKNSAQSTRRLKRA
jgi:hypothetical protein